MRDYAIELTPKLQIIGRGPLSDSAMTLVRLIG
jgi:hypothetical protein